MGLFKKNRKEIILNATAGLSSHFCKKVESLHEERKISKYEMHVLLFLLIGAEKIIDNLFKIEYSPLYKLPDKELGVEGNALNAYYSTVIFLLYVHNHRLNNKKELRAIADVDKKQMATHLENVLSLENDNVSNQLNHLEEMHKKFDENTMEVFNYQIILITESLMADGRGALDLFKQSDVRLFLPLSTNTLLIELVKAMDEGLGIAKEKE